MVNIYIGFVDLESRMLQTKVQGHQTSGSEEEEFEMLNLYIGMAAILVM